MITIGINTAEVQKNLSWSYLNINKDIILWTLNLQDGSDIPKAIGYISSMNSN